MSRPVLRVARVTLAESVDGIWESLDIEWLDDLDGLEITRDVAPRSAWVVGGEGDESDAEILRRWDAGGAE